MEGFLMTLIDFKTSGQANEGATRLALPWGYYLGPWGNFKGPRAPERPFPAIQG